jgi:hypothetical protein
MTWETKNPPAKDGRYLVTLETPFGRQVRQADRYKHHAGYWSWSVLPSGGSDGVIAWMKGPEPFAGPKP